MVKNVLGNRRAENYKELMEKRLKSLQEMGVNMNFKAHFLHSDLDIFAYNYGEESDNSIKISK